MSYIFEALQRAEAERSGGTLPREADSVADLLQKVEQEIDRKQSLSELPVAAKPDSPAADSFTSAKVLIPALRADSRLVCLTDQGQPGCGKISRARIEAAAHARKAEAQKNRGDWQSAGRREESDCGQSGAQSIPQQGSPHRTD